MSQKAIELILMRQLASSLAMPIFLVDPSGNLLFYNEPAEQLLGRRYDETGEMSMKEWCALFAPIAEDGEGNRSVAYLPDHEPALGVHAFPAKREWTSGFDLAADADLLIHDAQYTTEEYQRRVGWGHSSMHDDAMLDRIDAAVRAAGDVTFALIAGMEGATFEV